MCYSNKTWYKMVIMQSGFCLQTKERTHLFSSNVRYFIINQTAMRLKATN